MGGGQEFFQYIEKKGAQKNLNVEVGCLVKIDKGHFLIVMSNITNQEKHIKKRIFKMGWMVFILLLFEVSKIRHQVLDNARVRFSM